MFHIEIALFVLTQDSLSAALHSIRVCEVFVVC